MPNNHSKSASSQGDILSHASVTMRTGRALHAEAARLNGPNGTGALSTGPRPSIHPRLRRGGIEIRVFRVGNVLVMHWD
ncbi:hypothetical protein [Caudoviricetes sp.]|nr:hypothetical protein [Caudoviricetes sp.]